MAHRHLYLYSESLNRKFPVARLDWADWYRALNATSAHLDNEELLANLLREASKETRSPVDPVHDMPWYERENYTAHAVTTAGWGAPHPKHEQDGDEQPAAEQLYFESMPAQIKYPVSPLDWSAWYATAARVNPQLDDLDLLGELIHAASFVAQDAGMSEPEQHRYLAHAIITARWTHSEVERP